MNDLPVVQRCPLWSLVCVGGRRVLSLAAMGAVTSPSGREDVRMVGEAIQQCSRKFLVAKDLHPLGKGQVQIS